MAITIFLDSLSAKRIYGYTGDHSEFTYVLSDRLVVPENKVLSLRIVSLHILEADLDLLKEVKAYEKSRRDYVISVRIDKAVQCVDEDTRGNFFTTHIRLRPNEDVSGLIGWNLPINPQLLSARNVNSFHVQLLKGDTDEKLDISSGGHTVIQCEVGVVGEGSDMHSSFEVRCKWALEKGQIQDEFVCFLPSPIYLGERQWEVMLEGIYCTDSILCPSPSQQFTLFFKNEKWAKTRGIRRHVIDANLHDYVSVEGLMAGINGALHKTSVGKLVSLRIVTNADGDELAVIVRDTQVDDADISISISMTPFLSRLLGHDSPVTNRTLIPNGRIISPKLAAHYDIAKHTSNLLRVDCDVLVPTFLGDGKSHTLCIAHRTQLNGPAIYRPSIIPQYHAVASNTIRRLRFSLFSMDSHRENVPTTIFANGEKATMYFSLCFKPK